MSGIDGGFGSFLLEIELFTFQNCQPYEHSWLSAFLSLGRYAPQLITVALFAVGAYKKELYLLFFGFGLLGNTFVNYGLNMLVPSEPRIETCTPRYGNTFSYQVQHIVYFSTFLLGYAVLYRARIAIWNVLLVVLLQWWIVIGAHFLNYYRASAIVSSAIIGAIDALIWQSLLYWFVVPQFGWLVKNNWVSWMGYQDTLSVNDAQTQQVNERQRAVTTMR